VRPRLICLAHAGGTSRVFAGWVRSLAGVCEVRPLEMPGRGVRMREPLATRIAPLAREVAAELSAPDHGAVVAFGHSMGGLIAYAAALRAVAAGRPPAGLVLAGVSPPHLGRHAPLHALSDEALRERLRELGGTPREALDSVELMEIMLPIVRADLEVCETYRSAPIPLPCPITAISASADSLAPPSAVAQWQRYTAAGFDHVHLPGDHFFGGSEAALIAIVRERVLRFAG
jgi:surfactin synthase thioesterase subunit